VLNFTSADDFYDLLDAAPTPSPIFLKFYEPWCDHCKRLAPTFSATATYLRNTSVRFMQVQCSANDGTKSWCQRHDVSSYPQLLLFTGEQKIKFEEEMRSVAAFDRFFTQKVDGYTSVVLEQRKGNKKRKTMDAADSASQDSLPGDNAKSAEETSVTKKVAIKGVSQEAKGSVVDAQLQAKARKMGGAIENVSQWSVEQRLGALEGEVKEMHDTLKEIKKAVEALTSRR
jgi:thiol-disulfide isomerase/thioredoxin